MQEYHISTSQLHIKLLLFENENIDDIEEVFWF